MDKNTWLDLPLARRLGLALAAGLAASLMFSLATEAIEALKSAPAAQPGSLVMTLPPAWTKVVTVGVHGLCVSAALILVALRPPRGALGWIVAGLGGGLLGLLLQVGWSSQQLQIALGAPLDYPAALDSSLEMFSSMFEAYGGPRATMLVAAMTAAGALLLPWGWALSVGHKGWALGATVFIPVGTWAWILESIQASIFEGASVGLSPVLPALAYTLALLLLARVLHATWLRAGEGELDEEEPSEGEREREREAVAAGS